MNTLKTAIVVLLLLVVLYGVYTTLNSPIHGPPPEVAQQASNFQPPQVDIPLNMPGLPAPGAAPASSALLATPAATPAPALENRTPPPLQTNAPSAFARLSQPNLAGAAEATDSKSVTNAPALVDVPAATPGPAYPTTGAKALEETLNVGARAFDRAWGEAEKLLAKGQLAEALKALSVWYQSPDLKPEQQQQLLKLLDQLAGTVIFSTEHYLEPAYAVKRGETLEQVSEQYQVPVQLLANINGLKAPYPILAGQSLKVVRGPFRAEVNLAPPHQLTLFLGQNYAGRFDVALGANPPPKEGNYSVLQKMIDHAFFPPEGGSVPAGAAGNPYGGHWLGLEDQMCVHGTGGNDTAARGCISLSPRDAADVYNILTVGSRIAIRR